MLPPHFPVFFMQGGRLVVLSLINLKTMRKLIVSLTCMFLLVLPMFGQGRVSGTVRDANGDPVPGVAVFVGYGWLILIEPVLVAAYVQLGFSEENRKRGQISNWALCAVTILGMLVWMVNPYVDAVYYGSCVLMMIGVVWCFFDALYYYNQLMTRPLPQFHKTGGDDHA